jgi:outer membrane protein
MMLGVFALGLVPLQSALAGSQSSLYASGGSWAQNYLGEFTRTQSVVDLEQDLVVDEDNYSDLYGTLEYGVPGLPHVRAQKFSFDTDDHSVLSRAIAFDSQDFNVAQARDTIVDIEQTDAVLYYPILGKALSLDLGVTVSYFEGSIEMTDRTQRGHAEFEEFIPMLYVKARTTLPVRGLWLGAQAQGVSYADTSMAEFNAQLGWEHRAGLGLEAGYRVVRLELDDFDEVQYAELEVSGPYAALRYHF